jgi:hypothetical protein
MRTTPNTKNTGRTAAMRANLRDYMGSVTISTLEHHFPREADKLGILALSDEALAVYSDALQARRRQAVAKMTTVDRTERRQSVACGMVSMLKAAA